MFAPHVGEKGLPANPPSAVRRLPTRRIVPLFFGFALVSLLQFGCGGTTIVRVPIPAADIIKANEAARDADLSFARRDFYASLIKYLEAGRLNPNSEFIYNKLGIAYSQLQYYDEATNAFQRSIGLNPKYPYSYNNLGTVRFATGEKKSAEKFFRKAISLSPNTASFHVNLGTLYFEMGKMQKGMVEYRKGLAIDPVGLRPSLLVRGRHIRRMDHDRVGSEAHERPVDPEPEVAGFIDRIENRYPLFKKGCRIASAFDLPDGTLRQPGGLQESTLDGTRR